MFAPGDREFAGTATGFGAGFGAADASPRLTTLTNALVRLAAVSDAAAQALARHDRLALVASNEQADALVDQVNQIAATLSDEDRVFLPEYRVPALCALLAAGSRRNALLIENAWATDAALMRLLLGLGKVSPDGSVGGYNTPSGPTYLDRGA
jgi:hypothetical protein